MCNTVISLIALNHEVPKLSSIDKNESHFELKWKTLSMCKSDIPQAQAHSYGRLQDTNLTHYQQPGSDSMLWTGNANHTERGTEKDREWERRVPHHRTHVRHSTNSTIQMTTTCAHSAPPCRRTQPFYSTFWSAFLILAIKLLPSMEQTDSKLFLLWTLVKGSTRLQKQPDCCMNIWEKTEIWMLH